MEQFSKEIKIAVKGLIKYIFRSEDERITKLVEIYRKRYEKYFKKFFSRIVFRFCITGSSC